MAFFFLSFIFEFQSAIAGGSDGGRFEELCSWNVKSFRMVERRKIMSLAISEDVFK